MSSFTNPDRLRRALRLAWLGACVKRELVEAVDRVCGRVEYLKEPARSGKARNSLCHQRNAGELHVSIPLHGLLQATQQQVDH
jgi:hypothetical protein